MSSYRYCPRCAGELGPKMVGGRERLACPNCNFIHFGEFSIGVGGVVIDDGKVLLIRRGIEPFAGWWQIPGGYTEFDENIDAAVVREVQEESGILARPLSILGVRNAIGGIVNGQGSTNVYVMFLMEKLSGEAHIDGDESSGASFVPLSEVETMDKVQNLTKWAIGTALRHHGGFEKIEEEALQRPGATLFGLR